MSSSYRIELDRWLSQLDVKSQFVLDVGGSQLPVKGRTRSWNVGKYEIADLPEPHINSPKPDIELDLNSATIYPLAAYTTIFCLEVFDYIWNPVKAMEILSLMLTPGGTLWVTFPSFYPLHQPIEDDALRYMPGAIYKLAHAVGLGIEQIIFRRPETNGLEQFYADERMRAAKHQDHHFTGMIVEFTK